MQGDEKDWQIDLGEQHIPQYIAVEGPIGVGKTTLTKKLARTFNYETLLEKAEENPFLERFYANEKNAALPTQLFFLFQRMQQLNELRQHDLFQPVRVADFLIEKDQLFAQVTLSSEELRLYQQVYDHTTIDAPRPDLVIYLQAPIDILLERIHNRGIRSEQTIDGDYLEQLNAAYTNFFHYYDEAPLLIVNAAEIDWVNNPEDYRELVNYMLNITSGRHYYNPQPSMLR
ncbi:Deoxyadenosine/deoxycytidine kinase [Alteromonadaceae bacterium Bs31]|nr:Deoxyadenosine/deoxycytidine kinase [Alteromonadaceae bacterium Bs31]